jgi:hypothetical protein
MMVFLAILGAAATFLGFISMVAMVVNFKGKQPPTYKQFFDKLYRK